MTQTQLPPVRPMEERLQSLTRELTELTEALRSRDPALEGSSPEQLEALSEAADAFARQKRGHLGYISGIVGGITQAPVLALFATWGAFREIPPDGAISYRDLAAKVGADTAIISCVHIKPPTSPLPLWDIGEQTANQLRTKSPPGVGSSRVWAPDASRRGQGLPHAALRHPGKRPL